MTIRDLITAIVGLGANQADIARVTGIPSSTQTRIRQGIQADVFYQSGRKLEKMLSDLSGRPFHEWAAEFEAARSASASGVQATVTAACASPPAS